MCVDYRGAKDEKKGKVEEKLKQKKSPLDRNRAGDLSVYDFAITAERDSQLHHKGVLLVLR